MDLFIIGNVEAEHMPLAYRFELDRHVGLGVSGEFWAVNVKRLVEELFLGSAGDVVRELNLLVLEEVCHYLGWRHSPKGRVLDEVDFFRRVVGDCG